MGNNNVKDYPPYFDYPKPRKPITNYDSLRAKSMEEMAEFMKSSGAGCPDGHFVGDYDCKDCKNCWLNWLKQEAGE